MRLDTSFTWAELPPLHARFVGVSYLFGGVYMIGCLLATHRSQVSPALPAIGIFTSLLLLVTLLEPRGVRLRPRSGVGLDGARTSCYPVLAFTLGLGVPTAGAARSTGARARAVGRAVPPGRRRVVFGVLGVGLLTVRETMVDVWPWPITTGLAQFYGGPFLAYALLQLGLLAPPRVDRDRPGRPGRCSRSPPGR